MLSVIRDKAFCAAFILETRKHWLWPGFGKDSNSKTVIYMVYIGARLTCTG
jgi:hypothetical protein